jgi:phosphatidate cytidylyltransferase
MDDRYGHPPEDEGPSDPAEGVRIIGAEEAAEALERGDVAPRLPDSQPRFGDRPPSLPEGVRPALRFPLSADADPTELIRPAVVPPAVPDDTQGPASGQVELPHWTDPPTGEVPAVLSRDDTESDDDLDVWSTFAGAPPTPRWRGEPEDWSDNDYEGVTLGDDDTRLGALDDRERPTDDELFSFDDVDEIVAREPVASRAPIEPYSYDDDPTHDDYDDLGTEPVYSQYDEADYDDAGYAEVEEAPHERPSRRRRRRSHEPSGAVPAARRGLGTPQAAGRDVTTATVVGVGFAIVAIILFAIGSAAAAALAVIVIALCAGEFFGAVQRGGARPAALLGLVASVAFPLAVYWKGEPAFPLIVSLTVIFTMVWFLAGAGGEAPVLEGVGITLFGVLWIGALGSYSTLMLRAHDGRGILLAVVLVTVAYDVGAFFFGRSVGRRPVSQASPNKTVEGLLGGTFLALVMGVLVGLIKLGAFHTLANGILLALIVSVAGPLGDFCESVVKRDLGIKDMGSVLPGHGGLLDRFDALLFVLPAAYYAIVAFHLVG